MPRPLGLAVALLCALAPLLGAARGRAAVSARTVGPVRAASTGRTPVQDVAPLPRDAALRDALAPGTGVRVTVALKPRAGLAAIGPAVSPLSSPEYHRILSVAQFAAQFGAGPAAAATVRTTLERSGLRVGRLSADGLSLPAQGTAAEVEGAFATRLARVALPHRRNAYADVEDPTLPAPASGDVQGVIGLDSLPIAHPEGLVRHRAAGHPAGELVATAHGPSTCLDAQAAGDTAQEIASAYGLDGLWDAGDVGAGTTVALFELEPFSAADRGGGDDAVASLEVTLTTAELDEEQALFEEAATYGETVYVAAGDSGAAGCGGHTRAVEDPASQPDVTGVGGTSLANYLDPSGETVWNDSSTDHGAGGGGLSAVWSVPSYQASLAGATSPPTPTPTPATRSITTAPGRGSAVRAPPPPPGQPSPRSPSPRAIAPADRSVSSTPPSTGCPSPTSTT